MKSTTNERRASVAIIGMAGRFPDAPSVDKLWENLAAGVHSIRPYSTEEVLAAGAEPSLVYRPNYVKAGTLLEGVDRFDAGFFGYPPREAEVMDPQHRLFLECAWEALEDAVCDCTAYPGSIGVFAGTASPGYMMLNLLPNLPLIESVGEFQLSVSNCPDALASRISYRFNLRGPAVSVQTFCSTSLVAVHLACQSLLIYESDIALAGGVAVSIPPGAGYLYQEGSILSPDGVCRAFDARAQGSVIGSGLGIVVLKRLEDALADGDRIRAVILGSAVNNDGIQKVGYSAPGVAGQSSVILQGLSAAGVDADSISYIETHGTGTPLGDAVELSAMTRAFRRSTQRRQFCAIGSVKPNIGHLDRAAGVTGLITATLALENKLRPPSVDFESPSPDVDLENSPFYVNTRLTDWPANGSPRRAGVNSFGVGGTNAHVVLEEAPEPEPSSPAGSHQLLLLSAKTETALDQMTRNLADRLRAEPSLNPADVEYTLQVGRAAFAQRRATVCRGLQDAIDALEHPDPKRVFTLRQASRDLGVAFLLSGVGDHYPGMAQELYEGQARFRESIDRCGEILTRHVRWDLRDVLYSGAVGPPRLDWGSALNGTCAAPEARHALYRTEIAQPTVFAVEYALSKLLESWGIRPQALLGYSVGEYVAACLSGVMTLEGALELVAARGRLIQELAPGAMLAVFLGEAEVRAKLPSGVSLSAVNGAMTCVVAGAPDAVVAWRLELTREGVASRPLETEHAFHTPHLEPVREAVAAVARRVGLAPPRIPVISNVTGRWMTAQQATDPEYWARHMCETVRFDAGIATLLQGSEQVLLEVGAGQSLGSFVKQHRQCPPSQRSLVMPTLPAMYERQSETGMLLGTVGRLWLAGVSIDWKGFHAGKKRQRVSLPTYPFERQRYWVEPVARGTGGGFALGGQQRRPDVGDWFAVTSWMRTPSQDVVPEPGGCWLLLADARELGTRLGEWLRGHGQDVVLVRAGEAYSHDAAGQYRLRPGERSDYQRLLEDLRAQGKVPTEVVHGWLADSLTDDSAAAVDEVLELGFYSLLALTQALGDDSSNNCRISIVSTELQEVVAGERTYPAKAALIGACRVIPLEYLHLTCRSIDLGSWTDEERLIEQLGGELCGERQEAMVALHGSYRWVQRYEPLKVGTGGATKLRHGGVYLITGGLGGIGLGLAEYLAEEYSARLVLVGRSALSERPDRSAQVQALEARGSEVLVLQADVGDAAQMRSAVQQAVQRFGTIHGVIHAAGVPGIGLMQLKSAETARAVLRPKVQGTLALSAALAGLKLDFLVLFSSVTSANGGGPGQVDYCAANAFMDAWANQCPEQHGQTVSISWGEWLWDAWQEGLQGYPEEARAELIRNRQAYGLSFREGAEAICRALTTRLSHVFVTTRDLRAMVEDMENSTAGKMLAKLAELRQAQPLYPRPVLGTTYIAPRNDVEGKVAAMWQAVLGIEQIGIDDSFFELGGNSLLGIGLVDRMRREFQQTLPAHVLYEAPTVSALAALLPNLEATVAVQVEPPESESNDEKRRERLLRFKTLAQAD